MLTMLRVASKKPILFTLGVLMSTIVALAVVGMASSVVIARTTAGLAAAVNQSGSLRMQSYRIGMALADTGLAPAARAERIASLATEFEARLASPRLVDAIAPDASDPVAARYGHIRALWREEMRPPLLEEIGILRAGGVIPEALQARFLEGVDAFVVEIDALVGMLERVAEGRIAQLRLIEAVALVLTVVVALVSLILVLVRVIHPLDDLLACADRATGGDFSGRTRHTGEDELGRLGAALNRMGGELSRTYGELERRVRDKTADLERSNQSLDLLYGVSRRLEAAPISEPLFREVMADIEGKLGVGPVTLCLQDSPSGNGARWTLTNRSPEAQRRVCGTRGCLACREARDDRDGSLLPAGDGRRRAIVSFPVSDRDTRFGLLLVDLEPDQTLDDWQRRLLSTLAGHIGTAINLDLRLREGRRLALHEERGIIARELHDSLAQSLSYLKIQAARLGANLPDDDANLPARAILGELRDGINSAYRQLRELLGTFRLQMDDRGLAAALEQTVADFQARGSTAIRLDNGLPRVLLSPNEELHVLQIVRESLSNVIRHADAAHAWVRLTLESDTIEVSVRDDGHGVLPGNERPGQSHGLTIMRERAESLDGELHLADVPGSGTEVRLRFRHRAAAPPPPPPRSPDTARAAA